MGAAASTGMALESMAASELVSAVGSIAGASVAASVEALALDGAGLCAMDEADIERLFDQWDDATLPAPARAALRAQVDLVRIGPLFAQAWSGHASHDACGGVLASLDPGQAKGALMCLTVLSG